MFSKILVPIDVAHTESCELAIEAAKKLADAASAKMTLLAVIADVPNLVADQLPSDHSKTAKNAALKQLEKIAGDCGLDEKMVDMAVRHGSPYHEILEQAETAGVDLIVVASHRPELSDYLLGTVAAKVVRHANCSVLVVRE